MFIFCFGYVKKIQAPAVNKTVNPAICHAGNFILILAQGAFGLWTDKPPYNTAG